MSIVPALPAELLLRLAHILLEASTATPLEQKQISKPESRSRRTTAAHPPEEYTPHTYLVALDGDTGAIKQKHLLPYGDYYSIATPPVVLADGSVVTLFNPHEGCLAGDATDLALAKVTRGGGFAIKRLVVPSSHGHHCFTDLADYRLLPDGDGGLIAAGLKVPDAFRIEPDEELGVRATLTPPNQFTRTFDVEYVVGADTAYALVKGFVGSTQINRRIAFDPATLSVLENSFLPGTALYHRIRSAGATEGVFISGPSDGSVIGNEQPVSDGLNARLGTTPALVESAFPIASLAAYAAAGSQSANAPRHIHGSHVVPPDVLVEAAEGVDPIIVEMFKGRFQDHQIRWETVPQTVLWYIREEATIRRLRAELRQADFVAFIGHSVLNVSTEACPTTPTCAAQGLQFHADKVLVRHPWTHALDQGRPRAEWQYTTQLAPGERVPIRAKVTFIAGCALFEDFREMWALPPGGVLIVPNTRLTQLHVSGLAWREVLRLLLEHGMDVKSAVDVVNETFLPQYGGLRFVVFGAGGGHDVRLR